MLTNPRDTFGDQSTSPKTFHIMLGMVSKWRWLLLTIAAYTRTHSPSRVAWCEGQRPIGALRHSSNEPSELSQWRCGHDDSTI